MLFGAPEAFGGLSPNQKVPSGHETVLDILYHKVKPPDTTDPARITRPPERHDLEVARPSSCKAKPAWEADLMNLVFGHVLAQLLAAGQLAIIGASIEMAVSTLEHSAAVLASNTTVILPCDLA
jgi:hypothetical protein